MIFSIFLAPISVFNQCPTSQWRYLGPNPSLSSCDTTEPSAAAKQNWYPLNQTSSTKIFVPPLKHRSRQPASKATWAGELWVELHFPLVSSAEPTGYTGLLCLGFPIGISPALVYGLDPGPCSNFNRLPQIPPPNDPSNPRNVQGASSLEMICTEPWSLRWGCPHIANRADTQRFCFRVENWGTW